MEDKWGIDFKKLRKNSSMKLLKERFGSLISPREEAREDGIPNNTHSPAFKKTQNFNNENIKQGLKTKIVDQSKDYIDDIPVIPSLDDFVDDEITNQIIKAPLIGVKQIASYKDLENDLLQHSAFASLEEVNLQVLIKLLHTESSLDEPDTLWTKENIFNEMVSVFNGRQT